MDLDKTRELLRSVPHSYTDFVEGIILVHGRYPEQIHAMEEFILMHPDATSGEVLEFMDQFLDLHDFEKEGYPETPVATPVTEVVA